MKKKILIALAILSLSVLSYFIYTFYIQPTDSLQSIYLIPKDAIYIVETQEPIDNWDKISKSDIWNHLQKNTHFNELTTSLNDLDVVFHEKKQVFEFIGNRSVLISAHMIKKKEYGLFYVVDLEKFSKLKLLKNNLNSLVSKNFKVTKRNYHNEEIHEIYDKKSRLTLYISFIKNQLIASYTHTLVEAAIDQYNEPFIGRDLDFIEISKKVGYDDLFRCYIQYDYLDDYMRYFSDKPNEFVTLLSNSLVYSGFNLDLKSNDIIYANGFTNSNEKTASYIKALQKSGKGKRTIDKIAPQRTAAYISFAFDSFAEFYQNFEEIKQENPAQFTSYQDNLDKIENLLKIDIKEHFMSWMDNEIALLHMQSTSISSQKNETSFVIKANDIKKAKKNLDFVTQQIRKRTPVKFKTITYREHDINFLSIKGFFKVFLGNLFSSFDKPYFTIIDDYVVFSNNPNTLKNIINDHIEEKTLANNQDYKRFIKNFETKSSAFTYVNTPTLFKSLQHFADRNTSAKLKKNKDFIICFPEIGFQLTPRANLFESRLVVQYIDPEIVKTKDQFKEVNSVVPNEHEIEEPESNENLLTVDKDAVFTIAEIHLDNLNDDEYIKKYTNGKTHISASFKDGVKHGRYREYYPNGETKISGRFKKGEQIGTWKYYNAEGKLIHKKKF